MASSQQRITDAWCRWLKQLIHDDCAGRWVAFSLTTRYSILALAKRFAEKCQAVDGWLPSDTPEHQRQNGTCAYILPSTSASDHRHAHGLIRIPADQCVSEGLWVSATIHRSNNPLTIAVPHVLKRLLWKHNDSPYSTFGNIHLRHENGRVDLLTPDSTQSVLNYWNQNFDGEYRDFDQAVFAPWRFRAALNIRQGRSPIKASPPKKRSRRISAVRESVEQFLARGGCIEQAPPAPDPRDLTPLSGLRGIERERHPRPPTLVDRGLFGERRVMAVVR